MGGRRIALVPIAALTAAVVSGRTLAQPKDPGGDIEIEPAKTGSAGAGAPGAVTPPPAPIKDPKVVKKWLTAAQQLMQKGSYLAANNRTDEAKAQFENAVTAYQKAIEAGGDVNLYFELAAAEARLGKLDGAVKHLRIIIATKAGVRPDIAKKAAGKLEELSAKIGLVTLTVKPAGSSITLGGTELGTSPLPEPLVLMPGTYTLAFQADGFQPKEAEIKIEPGSEVERTVELDPVKVIVEPMKPGVVDGTVQDGDRKPSKLPLYVGVGVTGAGILGAGIFGILAVKQHATFTGASTSTLDRTDARTNGRRFAHIADLSLGLAAVAAGVTAYWYFYKYERPRQKSPERHPPPVETKLEVVPWVQSQSGGVTIAGWF